ncbi:MAG: class I SAM-dependent methyltransferase [Chitinophagaceae bacterium]|nr:class I SAM-dependent methyltransferase [Chitinophagaceae bacterium]
MSKAIERIKMTNKEFYELENQIRIQEHLRRYAAIRRFIYGRVLDFACGCGYGTYLLSKSPEISNVIGIDKDAESIEWASKEFSSSKSTFLSIDVTDFTEKINTLVSLETIEHFDSNDIYNTVLENCEVDNFILSYPNKKSTHFNKFHLRDLTKQEVLSSFENYILYHTFSMGDVDFLLFIRNKHGMPSHIYKNLIDFR